MKVYYNHRISAICRKKFPEKHLKLSCGDPAGNHASFDEKATKATCTIILQEKYNGSWRTATGLPAYSYVKSASNTYTISASKAFTLKSGTVYRAKVVFADTNSSGTHYQSKYTGSF